MKYIAAPQYTHGSCPEAHMVMASRADISGRISLLAVAGRTLEPFVSSVSAHQFVTMVVRLISQT